MSIKDDPNPLRTRIVVSILAAALVLLAALAAVVVAKRTAAPATALPAVVQTAPPAPGGRRTRPLANFESELIQLRLRIMQEVSCSPHELTLYLRFIFKNTGKKPLILDKRSSIVARHMISRDLEAVAAKNHKEEGGYEDSGPYIPAALEVPSDMSNFLVLQPGEVYEVESPWTRSHFTVFDGSPHSEEGLSYGTHFLQVEVGTWLYASDDIAAKARRKWSEKGFLWSKPVISEPLEFTIDKNRPMSKCR